ncbi:MAG: hypothetical protein F4X65_12265 [Chloroflexi bacterium]|nr:hypothetical protein [Chloroflexota bacterium]
MSVLSRVIEEHGIATTTIAMVREHAERVKPPRALFVPFFFGFALGKPNDADFQHGVLKAALDLLSAGEGPVLEDFPDDTDPTLMPQASQVTASPEQSTRSAADEITALRAFYERWVDNNSGRTAVGLCGVPQRRFRGVIRFLEACAQGDNDADLAERPDGVSRPQFIRYCVDDLKAFYYEARMEQHKEADEDSLHRWFWGDTATGKLVTELAAVLNESDDPVLKGVAYGLAR